MKIVFMEKCEVCKKRYSTVYSVPDHIWREVTGHNDLSGLWCLSCFIKEAEKREINLFWQCAEGRYPGNIPPVMPENCTCCPVLGCHKQTKYGGELCRMRLRSQLRKYPGLLYRR